MLYALPNYRAKEILWRALIALATSVASKPDRGKRQTELHRAAHMLLALNMFSQFTHFRQRDPGGRASMSVGSTPLEPRFESLHKFVAFLGLVVVIFDDYKSKQ